MSSFISRKDNAFFYSTADFIEKIPKNGFYGPDQQRLPTQ